MVFRRRVVPQKRKADLGSAFEDSSIDIHLSLAFQIIGMSVTPPLSEQLPRTNKFKGESFGVPTNTRTIYAGSEEDTVKRDSRVILLVGPQNVGKSSLIDFLCNYFYGADLEKTTRYHIANEKFDSTTPEKQIITYVFNDTVMDVRPVVIDTPSTSGAHAEENREILAKWLKDNERLKIDAIGVVFSAYHRMTANEEEYLQKALAVFPEHLRTKQIVFITGSDGSSPPVGMLRRFNLDRADVYKVNTSCIFQRPEEDPLQEHLRGNYWKMSIANFGALFSRLKYGDSPSFATFEYEPPSATSPSLQSSASSQNSVETVIRRLPNGEEVRETKTTTVDGDKVTTTTKTTKLVKSVHSKEDVIVHPPSLVTMNGERGAGINGEDEKVETTETITILNSYKDGKGPKGSAKGPYDPYKYIHKAEPALSRVGFTTIRSHDSQDSHPSRTSQEKSPSPLRPAQAPPAPPPSSTSSTAPSRPAASAPPPSTAPKTATVPLQRDTSGLSSKIVSTSEKIVTESFSRKISTENLTDRKFEPGHYNDEVPREYADERTPATSPRSTGLIAQLGSVPASDHAQQTTSSTYTRTQDKPSTLTNAGIRDINRYSNVPNHLSGSEVKPAESPPGASAIPYTAMRTNGPAAIGTTLRKSRETTIDDPYYPPIDPYRESTNPARHSWHEIRPNQIVDVQMTHARPKKETLIDFPSPPEHIGLYQKNVTNVSSSSQPVPSPRTRSVDRIDTITQYTVPGPLIHTPQFSTFDPSKQGATERYGATKGVEVRQRSDYSTNVRRYDEVPSTEQGYGTRYDVVADDDTRRYDEVPTEQDDGRRYETVNGYASDQTAAKGRRDQKSLGAIAGENGAMRTETAQPAYALIHKGNSRDGRDLQASSEATMREREDMLRKTRTDVDRASYPGKGRPKYGETVANVDTRGVFHDETLERNEFMIPEQMRANKSPITVRVLMGKKHSGSETSGGGGGQYNASDYGDDWGEETTIIRKVDNTQPRPQLIEERYRAHHYGKYREGEPGKEQQQRTAPPPYGSQISPAPVNPLPAPPPAAAQSTLLSGANYGDVEYAGGDTRLLKDGQEPRFTTKKKTSKTTSTTVQPGQTRFLNWSPMNCSNPRDCCLNCLFCVIAPMVVLLIILAIILTLVLG